MGNNTELISNPTFNFFEPPAHYAVIYQLPICFVGLWVGVWWFKAIEIPIILEIVLDFIVETLKFLKNMIEFILRIRRKESLIPCPRHVSGTLEIRQE